MVIDRVLRCCNIKLLKCTRRNGNVEPTCASTQLPLQSPRHNQALCGTDLFDRILNKSKVNELSTNVFTDSLPEIEAYISLSLSFWQSPHPKPSEANLPGIKFSTSTSDFTTSCSSIFRPSGFLKSTVMDLLFLLAARKYADSGGKWEVSAGASGESGAAGGNHDPGALRRYEGAIDNGSTHWYRPRD